MSRSLFWSRRVSAERRAALLNELVDRAASHDRPVVVFDLDGTLMDNRPRVVAILHELAEHWQHTSAEAARNVARAHADALSYGLRENLERLGVADARLIAEGEAFWIERFFTDAYLRHDAAMEGAAAFVWRLYRAGANIVYLTGRDLPKMALGTFASLRDHGFPIGVIGTELVTKPNFDLPDERFKKDVARDLVRLGEVLAVFDNEPANCNTFLEAHSACMSFLVDTHHAPDPPELRPEVHVIDGFEI
jgi:hypothetical protein